MMKEAIIKISELEEIQEQCDQHNVCIIATSTINVPKDCVRLTLVHRDTYLNHMIKKKDET